MKHDQSIQSVVASSRVAEPVVDIRSYALSSGGTARVVIDVTHTSESRENPQLIKDVLRKKLGGKLEAISGSFVSIDKGMFSERLTGVVGAVRQIISVSGDESLKGFSAFASNMFMDEEQSMWVMRQTPAGKILVKSTGIDDDQTLTSLLQSCSSATASAAANNSEFRQMLAQASAVVNSVDAGDYVSYVGMNNVVEQGFVVASVADSDKLVVMAQNQEAEQISRMAVTQIHDASLLPKYVPTDEEQVEIVVATSRGIDLDFLLNYYKRVYARSPEFFAQFAQRLQSHQFC